jgi:hypothetical protein
LSFHDNRSSDSVLSSKQYRSGAKAAVGDAPASPTWSGRLFLGWFKDKGHITPFRFRNESYGLTGDTDVYAGWGEFTFTPVSGAAVGGTDVTLLPPKDASGAEVKARPLKVTFDGEQGVLGMAADTDGHWHVRVPEHKVNGADASGAADVNVTWKLLGLDGKVDDSTENFGFLDQKFMYTNDQGNAGDGDHGSATGDDGSHKGDSDADNGNNGHEGNGDDGGNSGQSSPLGPSKPGVPGSPGSSGGSNNVWNGSGESAHGRGPDRGSGAIAGTGSAICGLSMLTVFLAGLAAALQLVRRRSSQQ